MDSLGRALYAALAGLDGRAVRVAVDVAGREGVLPCLGRVEVYRPDGCRFTGLDRAVPADVFRVRGPFRVRVRYECPGVRVRDDILELTFESVGPGGFTLRVRRLGGVTGRLSVEALVTTILEEALRGIDGGVAAERVA